MGPFKEFISNLGVVGSGLVAIGTALLALTDWLDNLAAKVGLPALVVQSIAIGLVAALAWNGWQRWRRLSGQSRLLKTDNFKLEAKGPETLIGRNDDIERLLAGVQRNKLYELDGDSGCGKSALIAAGLVPRLRDDSGFVPLHVRDWGDDFVRGPFVETLVAINAALSADQKRRIGWSAAPDLTAETEKIAGVVKDALVRIFEELGQRPLLIADQFDDYQARHHSQFRPDGGEWITPAQLAAANPFWALVQERLAAGELRLLSVSRSDRLSALFSVRFEGYRSLTLGRVGDDYLGEVLDRVARTSSEEGPVIANPDAGWTELCSLLEEEFRREQGGLLMQQVRTVLLGLMRLPALTPAAYRRAGGLRGIETLYVERALSNARTRLGRRLAGDEAARRVLGEFIQVADPNQPPKAQRRTKTDLAHLGLSDDDLSSVLDVLKGEELLRSVDDGGKEAWQLDHDYLAYAVQREASGAEQWRAALRVGLARYKAAAGSLRQRWGALLPLAAQARYWWARLRKADIGPEEARYARASLLKPAAAVAILAAAAVSGAVYLNDQRVTQEARALISQFGTAAEAQAVLAAWRAPEAVRMRLYRLVQQDGGDGERAARSGWPLAHAGLEEGRGREAAAVLREWLLRLQRSDPAAVPIAGDFAMLALRVGEPEADAVAEAIRARLEAERDPQIAAGLAGVYTALAPHLSEREAAQGVQAIRSRLVAEWEFRWADRFQRAYAALAPRLSDATATSEAHAIRSGIAAGRDEAIVRLLAEAYSGMAPRLTDAEVAQGAEVIRHRFMIEEQGIWSAGRLAAIYVGMADRFSDSEVAQGAEAIRPLLIAAGSNDEGADLAKAYAVLAPRLSDIAAASEAQAIRSRLLTEQSSDMAARLAAMYAALSPRLSDAELAEGTQTIRSHLLVERDVQVADRLAVAYTELAARLSGKEAALDTQALRSRLMVFRFGGVGSELSKAYANIAGRLTESAAASEAETIRSLLLAEYDQWRATTLAGAYVGLAPRLSDAEVARGAEVIRSRLGAERNPFPRLVLVAEYARLAPRLSDTEAALGAQAIRPALLAGPEGDLVLNAARAYIALAPRLSDTAVADDASAIRFRLLTESDDRIAGPMSVAYSGIAPRLSDTALEQGALAIRERLLREGDGRVADNLAAAYAASVRVKSARSPGLGSTECREDQRDTVRDLLVLGAHPFSQRPGPLLDAIADISGRTIESIREAVIWWVEACKGDPRTLRPQAISAAR